MLKVTVDGKSYEVDNLKIDNQEAKVIEVFTGLRFAEIRQGKYTCESDALTVMVWLARKRNGEPELKPADVVFDMGEIAIEQVDDPTDKSVEGDPVPPTVPTGESEAGSEPG